MERDSTKRPSASSRTSWSRAASTARWCAERRGEAWGCAWTGAKESRAPTPRGRAGGAVGAISALASALPERVVAAVRERTPQATTRAAEARAAIERFPMPAALKTVCAVRGVPIAGDVRAPLRALDEAERSEL